MTAKVLLVYGVKIDPDDFDGDVFYPPRPFKHLVGGSQGGGGFQGHVWYLPRTLTAYLDDGEFAAEDGVLHMKPKDFEGLHRANNIIWEAFRAAKIKRPEIPRWYLVVQVP